MEQVKTQEDWYQIRLNHREFPESLNPFFISSCDDDRGPCDPGSPSARKKVGEARIPRIPWTTKDAYQHLVNIWLIQV